MSDVLITLGDVTLQGFEVPELIKIGGKQRLAVHQLIGGGRVVDTLGDEPAQIRLSGIFSGADAASRVQMLDATTASGAQIPLFWSEFFYTVIIESFAADYEKPWWIPFSIICAVVNDPVAVLASAAVAVTDLISNDIASVLSLSPQSGISLLLGGTPNAATLEGAQQQLASGTALSNTTLSRAAETLNSAATADEGGASLTSIVTSSGQLAALTNMSGYLNRASVNLANELL